MTCSVGLLTAEWAFLRLQCDTDQLHKIPVTHRFLRAVGRGWNGRWVPVHAGGLCWVVSVQNSALVGTDTGFHGRKPQDSTPGIFTVLRLSGLQSATWCCQPKPHIPAVCKWSKIMAKLQWLVVPVFYLRTDVCVSSFRHPFFFAVIIAFCCNSWKRLNSQGFCWKFLPHAVLSHIHSFSLCIHCETTVSQRAIHLSGC